MGTKVLLLWLRPVHERIFQLSNNMAATTRESPSSRYPSEKSVKEALDMLKPPGILSKVGLFHLKFYLVAISVIEKNIIDF